MQRDLTELRDIVLILQFGYGAPSLFGKGVSLTRPHPELYVARDNMRMRETAQEDRRKRGYHTHFIIQLCRYVCHFSLSVICILNGDTIVSSMSV